MGTVSGANLRGDYSKAAADYSVEQDWSACTPAAHALFRRLYERLRELPALDPSAQ